MAKFNFSCYCICSCSLLLLAQVVARPPPVPDDDQNAEQALEQYEKDKGKQMETNRYKQPSGSTIATEAPDDLLVISELGILRNIPRRNLRIYPTRRSVFQYWIDKAEALNSTDNAKKSTNPS